MKDPLEILREDTYTNEETNEMVGKMIKERYAKEQSIRNDEIVNEETKNEEPLNK